jgi:hypothetical protein
MVNDKPCLIRWLGPGIAVFFVCQPKYQKNIQLSAGISIKIRNSKKSEKSIVSTINPAKTCVDEYLEREKTVLS